MGDPQLRETEADFDPPPGVLPPSEEVEISNRKY